MTARSHLRSPSRASYLTQPEEGRPGWPKAFGFLDEIGYRAVSITGFLLLLTLTVVPGRPGPRSPGAAAELGSQGECSLYF